MYASASVQTQVHHYDAERDMMIADDEKVRMLSQMCSLCPTRALKISKTDHSFRENANWKPEYINRNLQTGIFRRRFALVNRNTERLPGLLGQNAYKRIPGNKSSH